jgi:1,4-alpha-glucan branching enzyme
MVTQTPEGKLLFQFYRPGSRQVVIAGDFNGWQHSFHMTKGADGWWRSQIELAPGTYRFRYLADGQWYTDYAAFGLEPCPYGWNSVLLVQPVEKPVVDETRREQLQPQAETLLPEFEEALLAPPQKRPVRQKPDHQPEPAVARRVRRSPAMVN